MPKRSRAARGQQKQQQQQPRAAAVVPNAFITPRLSATLDTVDPDSTSASDFYTRYIATRCPCLIAPPCLPSASSQSSGWGSGWATHQWSNAYLERAAGDCVVQAEQRGEKDAGFGSGRRVSLPFRQLIAAFERGETNLYMTTQYADDSSASPSSPSSSASPSVSPDLRYLVAPPLTALLPDFPLLPPLLSHLAPHQYNLWFGHSSRPTTSRLHHDYHDNIYFLLRGTKTFTLVSPAYALQLQTVGSIAEVKRNGLIVYEGDGEVHDDGSTERERLDVRREMLEDRIAQLEAEAEQLETKGAGASAAAVRAELDGAEEAMEELLEQTLTHTADDEDDADAGSDVEAEDADSDGVDEEELAAWQRWMQPRTRQPAARSPPAKRGRSHRLGPAPDADSPPNFSQLSTASLPASTPRLTLRLSAPSLLFLPAGWFHEVLSESSDAGGHLALNYWMRPPDVLQQASGEKDKEDERLPEMSAAASSFSRAYSAHELWTHRWKRQKEQLERERERVRQHRQKQQQQQQAEHDNGNTAAEAQRRGMFGQRGWRSVS